MININKADFGILCICALRYCYGRRTYMPKLVQDIIQTHFDDLDDNHLQIIANEETFQAGTYQLIDDCDKKNWENFYKKLLEYRQTKGLNK